MKLLQNDPDTGRIFSQPPLISFKRDKNIGNFLVKVHSKRVISPELLNAHAHDAKHVLLSATLRNCGLSVVYIEKNGATLLVGAW